METNRKPDFYMYGGEGPHSVLNIVRRCWKIGVYDFQGGPQMVIVRVDPPSPWAGSLRVSRRRS